MFTSVFLLNIVYFSVCLTSNKLYWIDDQLADVSTRFYTSASWSVGELTGYRNEWVSNGNNRFVIWPSFNQIFPGANYCLFLSTLLVRQSLLIHIWALSFSDFRLIATTELFFQFLPWCYRRQWKMLNISQSFQDCKMFNISVDLICISWKFWGFFFEKKHFIVWIGELCPEEPLKLWSEQVVTYDTLIGWWNRYQKYSGELAYLKTLNDRIS